MVRKTFTRNKLNSEKGVTGVDIVVSVTMIVISIAVVMAIFVNISSTSREVNRTSGATRMATNILENIELMYYEDFIDYLKVDLSHKTYDLNGVTTNIYTEETHGASDYNGTYLIPGEEFTTEKFFNTKIPNGYTLKLVISNVYGENNTSKYDLVRKVDVSILFDASGREKDVTLSTTKTFEKIDTLYNLPVKEKKYFTELNSSSKSNDFDNYGVTYVEEISATKCKAVANMPEDRFYGTTSAKPVMMIINNSTYVKSSDKTIRNLNDIYVWIPSHVIDAHGDIVYEYETFGIARSAVKKKNIVDGIDKTFFTVNKNIPINGYSLGFKASDDTRLEGKWMTVGALESSSVTGFIKAFWENYAETDLNND